MRVDETLPRDLLPEPNAQLGPALTSLVGTPLAALRATIESLAAEYDGGDPRGRILRGALAEVVRLSHSVEELVDLATPRPPMPLACGTREIVRGARELLPPDVRGRVWVACDACHELEIDGPLLSLCVARLALDLFARGASDVLVRTRDDDEDDGGARRDDDTAAFVVVGHAPVGPGARAARRRPDPLALVLARRDVDRMGGSLDVRRSVRGDTRYVVHVPAATRGVA